MKKVFINFIVIIYGIHCWGIHCWAGEGSEFQSGSSEVWVTTPYLTDRENLEKLADKKRSEIHNVDFVSSFEAQISHPVTSGTMSEILRLEGQAQSASLNGGFDRALLLFQELRSRLQGLPNVSGLEHVTLSVLIHLAELHDLLNDDKGSSLWKEARSWHRDTLQGDSEFSPKTIKKFNSYAYTPDHVLEIEAPVSSLVFIDGHKISVAKKRFKTNVSQGSHQLAVLTPGSTWIIQKVAARGRIKSLVSLRPEPLATGDCKSPRLDPKYFPQKTKLLVNFEGCDRVYFEKSWYDATGQKLGALLPGPSVSDMTTGMLSAPTQESWFHRMTESGWFWAGVGVVVIGSAALIIQSQNPKTVVVPTQTDR